MDQRKNIRLCLTSGKVCLLSLGNDIIPLCRGYTILRSGLHLHNDLCFAPIQIPAQITRTGSCSACSISDKPCFTVHLASSIQWIQCINRLTGPFIRQLDPQTHKGRILPITNIDIVLKLLYFLGATQTI